MNPEGDFATAGRELRARKNPNYEAACFHAQQCAEKYLKAILQEQSIPFGRTHNLIALLDLLLPHGKHSVYRWEGESRGAHKWRRKSRVSG